MKNQHAVSLGRLGGKVGGRARAATLTRAERSEIARQGALTRWSRDRHSRIRLAKKIAASTGADVGILEHALRLRHLNPIQRLVCGLRIGRMGLNVVIKESR